MRIRYNAPVILTFSLLAILILVLNATIMPRLTYRYFAVAGSINWGSVADWFRLFSHPLGHAGWAQLAGNLTFVLLLGPMLEARYGGRWLLLLMLITAVTAGLANVLLFNTTLLGASGVVFMLLALTAMTDLRAGTLPLTFLLLAAIFISGELLLASDRSASQLAHLIGGGVGALIGVLLRR
jgi:GlpG protein